MKLLRDLWQSFLGAVASLGAQTRFLLLLLWRTPQGVLRFGLVADQIYNTGTLSLVIIMMSGMFVGMVLGLQGFTLLQKFGSETYLGTAAAVSLFKELSPVITSLLFAGRAGTALTSEIGLMRATDQLSAMEMMAVDPVRRVVLPRFLGGVVALPMLSMVFSMVGIFGAWLVGVHFMSVDAGSFWSQMRSSVELKDVTEGIVKSVAFGVACSLIAVYQGYHATPTAEGVGRATTQTVVTSAVITLFLDYLLTAVFL